jgi:xanthine permease XanP
MNFLDRARDRRTSRPADIAYALDDVPPAAEVLPLVVQNLALQSIYFLLPGIVAAAAEADGLAATNFLCLTLVGLGLAALLQVATRGPVGSGYPIAFIPSPVFLSGYLLAAQLGDPAIASTMTIVAGFGGVLLALLLRRLNALVPTEVAGVVVFLIGVSLLPRLLAASMPVNLAPQERDETALIALGSLAVMMVVALTRTRFSRFGVLLGGAAGTAVALPLGHAPHEAAAVLADAAWIGIPTPVLPRLDWTHGDLLPAFLLALIASTASWLGDLLAFQRAADGSWARPDEVPIRRGLLANSLAMVVTGMIGGMAPATSSACVGLSIATGTLARRIAVVSGVALLLLACMPKVVALFVLVPEPVKAAMLAYVCCFMVAAGCQLITTRMLDARRTFVVGLGLSIGIAQMVAPSVFAALPRALSSPVTSGALLAFLLNLATQPFVARSARFSISTGPRMQQQVIDHCTEMGGAWGARRETAEHIGHCLLELGEILAARDLPGFEVSARYSEGLVVVLVSWDGAALPTPSARPNAADLEGPLAAQEAFAVWLATREATRFSQRDIPGGTEARLDFAD